MLYRFVICSFLLCTCLLYGQINVPFSQIKLNEQFYNPAFVSYNDYMDVSAGFRTQWTRLAQRPNMVFNFAFDFPLFAVNSGIGFQVINDYIGFVSNTGFSIDYAYGFRFKSNHRLHVGLSAGFYQLSIDGSRLVTPTGTYRGIFSHNDPILPTSRASHFTPDMSLGIIYNWKDLDVSVSVKHLINDLTRSRRATFFIPQSRVLHFLTRYRWRIKSIFSFEPAVYLQSDFGRVQTMFFAKMYYKDFVWGGVSVRGYSRKSIESFTINVGGNPYKGLIMNYSYDFAIAPSYEFNRGSHEIRLSYRFKPKQALRDIKIIYNPRFL